MPTLTFSKPSTTSAIFAMMKCNTKGTGLGNTEVITRLDGSNIVDVKFYDTIIASIDPTHFGNRSVKLYNGGFRTKTTKERLNSILSELTKDRVYIKQVKKQWVVVDTLTGAEIQFYEGMKVFEKHLTISDIDYFNTNGFYPLPV